MSHVVITIAVVAALMATAYAFSSFIRMLAIPELAYLAQGACSDDYIGIRAGGVANAAEVYEKKCECAAVTVTVKITSIF